MESGVEIELRGWMGMRGAVAKRGSGEEGAVVVAVASEQRWKAACRWNLRGGGIDAAVAREQLGGKGRGKEGIERRTFGCHHGDEAGKESASVCAAADPTVTLDANFVGSSAFVVIGGSSATSSSVFPSRVVHTRANTVLSN